MAKVEANSADFWSKRLVIRHNHSNVGIWIITSFLVMEMEKTTINYRLNMMKPPSSCPAVLFMYPLNISCFNRFTTESSGHRGKTHAASRSRCSRGRSSGVLVKCWIQIRQRPFWLVVYLPL